MNAYSTELQHELGIHACMSYYHRRLLHHTGTRRHRHFFDVVWPKGGWLERGRKCL